jgi:hypothetical protein
MVKFMMKVDHAEGRKKTFMLIVVMLNAGTLTEGKGSVQLTSSLS